MTSDMNVPNARPSVNQSVKTLVAFAAILLLSPCLEVFAQGKIAGRVTESGSGEPLIGVNVLVDGTQQGTITDNNGNYILVNMRPGDYTLVFSYIGFQTQRISGVRVTTGQTTRYNIQLSEQVIEGEEIIVQAERPLVQKDLTASKKTVVAEEIDALPVEGFFGVIATQAGVNQGPGGEIHIRGGRSNEVSYLVDGLSVGNPFDTNGLATSVASDAIQELTVISGAFNAEYGKAMSGIVNLVTKEGSDRYEGSFSAYGGDTFTSHEDIWFTPDGMRINDYTLKASLAGPLPVLKKVKFFVSGRLDADDGYIFGVREHSPSDSANFNEDPWYYEIGGVPSTEFESNADLPNELVPMNDRTSNNLVFKLTNRPMKGGKLEYSYIRDESERQIYNFAYRFNPDGVSSTRATSGNHSLHWTHTLNDRTFYTTRVSFARRDASTYLYEDPFDERYVPSNLIVGFPGTNFLFGGNQKGHSYESSQSIRAKFDITKQFGIIHETKVGVEIQRHRLDSEFFTVLYDRDIYPERTVPDVSTPSHDKYGCKTFVAAIPAGPDCTEQNVTEFSAYAQDKLEFEDFIINAGLRYEYFQPNGQYIPDLLDPKGELADATAKQLLLPRVGVSFPITTAGIIHFSYGHFAQMPSLRNLFVNSEFEFPVGTVPRFGNTNMRPERSVQYEIGLQQQIGPQLAFDITGFFKDIRDYLALQNIRYSTVAGEDQYSIYLNKDYANVRGVTFALTKRRAPDGLLSATVDYTFQNAEGNNNDSNAFFFNFLSGRENEFELVPLDFDQRHIISSTVTLSKPRNWSASFISQFSTGYPYTPLLLDQQFDQIPNNARKPSQLNVDAHIYKEFRFNKVGFRAFVKVFNLLDRLNERFVFNDTGRATYSLGDRRGVHAAWEPFYDLVGVKDLDLYNTRPHYYSAPREVSIGASINF